MQKVGSFKSTYCQSFRKESGMNGETEVRTESLLFWFHQRKPLWSQQRSGCPQSARRCLRWAGTEDASSAEKSSCRQAPLTNRAFCVVTAWPSDFLLVGRDYSSGFGFSNWKQLAWAAICLFNRLPHSMHSCQMTKIRLTLSAKTAFLQIIIFYLA